MTIPASLRRAGPFDGNDVTTEFPFAFKVFTKAEMQVTLTNPSGVESTLLLDSDYSVTISPDPQAPGGTVVYPIAGTPLPTGYRLTLTGRLPYSQTADIQNQGGFYPDVIEGALDRLAVQTQQLAERADRAVQVPVSSDTTPEQLIDQLVQASADAQAAASNAQASQTAAATSETNAATSASQALVSKNAAATSETNAATSASQALASKNAAATSETNAGTAADAAALSATSASDSKDAAALSAANAANSEANAAHSAELAEAAVDQITGNGIWVGSAVWWNGARAAIPAGLIPADGQEVPHVTYPDLKAALDSGVFSAVSESDWQADPLKRGKFVIESSTGNLRVPDLNGKSSGSIGALYATGDGANSPGAAGAVLQDAGQRIVGTTGIYYSGATTIDIPGTSGAFYLESGGAYGTSSPTDTTKSKVGFDSGRVARVDTYTRPNTVSGVWCIQAFGAVVNPGTVDAAQLASDLAALDAAFQTTKSKVESGNVGLGAGQTRQDVKASRAHNTTYTAPADRAIEVTVSGASGSTPVYFVVNGANRAAFTAVGSGTITSSVTMAIPAGSTYGTAGGAFTISLWDELR